MTSPTDSENDDRVGRALEALDSRFLDSTATNKELVEAIREEAHQRERKVDAIRRFTQISVVLIIIVLLSLGFLAVTVNKQNAAAKARSTAATEQRTQQQQDTNKLLTAIQGCTEPGGPCFRANRDDTAAALSMLQKFEYVSNYCAASNAGDPTEYKKCVISFHVPGAPTDLPTPSK